MSLTTCSRCILDEKDDPKIRLDAEGICQHCHNHDAMVKRFTFPEKELGFTEEGFEAYMQSPIHSHRDYPCYDNMRFNP